MHYGFEFRNVFYYILPVYDYNFKKFSSENILLTKLIKNCFDNKIKILEFGEGYQSYKTKFMNNIEQTFEITKSYSVKGFIFIY